MRMPVISRSAHERALRDLENESWGLREEIRRLRERERARMLCMDVVEDEARQSREAREALEIEANELRERVRLLAEDNRELRRRYDTARAELSRTVREVTTLRLMRTSLEARLAAESEVG